MSKRKNACTTINKYKDVFAPSRPGRYSNAIWDLQVLRRISVKITTPGQLSLNPIVCYLISL